MKYPTRPTPTLNSLPPGTQRLTIDGKREVFYSPLLDGPIPAEALTARRDIPTEGREITKTFKGD